MDSHPGKGAYRGQKGHRNEDIDRADNVSHVVRQQSTDTAHSIEDEKQIQGPWELGTENIASER
jgi:hypothetical protein